MKQMVKKLFLLFAVIIGTLFLTVAAEADDKPVLAGTIIKFQGEAETGQDPARKLGLNAPVYSGDVIVTGRDSRVQIKMTDGAVLTLSDDSIFEIESYLFSETEPSNAAYRLLQGAFRAVTGAINGTKDKDFAVKLPVATIGIRGTDFWGGSLDDVYNVALLDGKAIVVENAKGRVVIDKPGYGTSVDKDKKLTEPVKWSDSKLKRAVQTITFR